jgi:hypothetical protein
MNKMKLYTIAVLLLLTAFGVQSCKKDTSNPPPRLNVTSPIIDKDYRVNNVINVKASAHDEIGLKSFSLSVIEGNSQGQTHIDSFNWALNGNTDFALDSNMVTIHGPIYAGGIHVVFNFAATDVDDNTKKVSMLVSIKP